jgi:DNA-binding MarR family transcriptional regulator
VDSPLAQPADARAELIRLLQRYVIEAVRLGRAFAVRHGLHPTDWSALLAVIHGDGTGRPLTPGELAQCLGISSGATTAVVDRLERAGHVRRVRDARDRRRMTLHRGESATLLLRTFSEPLDAAMDAIVVGYSGGELDVVQRFLGDAIGQVCEHRKHLGEW